MSDIRPAPPEKLEAATLRDLLHYEPETGVFIWKARPLRTASRQQDKNWNTRFAGQVAGSLWRRDGRRPQNYWGICVFGKMYQAHRLAWVYMTGSWPTKWIDHRDGDGLNNSWSNLREATPSQNNQNSKRQKNNTTGFRGVSYHKYKGKFRAKINVNGVSNHLGYYSTAEDAHAAYRRAAVRIHGEFVRFK